MVLAGKLSTELGVKASADKWFKLFASQLHHVQNVCERVHATKLHEGDWHDVGSGVKHWTYVIDGQVHTCQETIDFIDEEKKTIKYNLFGGDINKHYKTFKFILEVFDNNEGGGAIVKWSVEYEKLNEDIDPPHAYLDYLNKCTRDIDAHLLTA